MHQPAIKHNKNNLGISFRHSFLIVHCSLFINLQRLIPSYYRASTVKTTNEVYCIDCPEGNKIISGRDYAEETRLEAKIPGLFSGDTKPISYDKVSLCREVNFTHDWLFNTYSFSIAATAIASTAHSLPWRPTQNR